MDFFNETLRAARNLQEDLNELSGPPSLGKIPRTNQVLDPDLFKHGLGYLIPVVHQINGTYESGWYDACAALLRRLVETLIIEVYEANQLEEKIKREGEFVSLRKLINLACQESCFKLTHDLRQILPEIALLGNTAAHNRISTVRRSHLQERRLHIQLLADHLIKVYKAAN